jgi:hypothetical protein
VIKKFIENISKRKVIVEKFPQPLDENCLIMEFVLPKLKKKSELIIKLKTFKGSILPTIQNHTRENNSSFFNTSYASYELQICSSIDDNSSSSFINWVDCFLKGKPYSGGAEISFFIFSASKFNKLLTLKGCALNSFEFFDGLPTVSIQFFSFQTP